MQNTPRRSEGWRGGALDLRLALILEGTNDSDMLRFLILALLACASHARYLNVHGSALQKCSQHGMALTGFSRTGECYAHDDDQGSHHVCIDLSSTTGGNFCAVTVRPARLQPRRAVRSSC